MRREKVNKWSGLGGYECGREENIREQVGKKVGRNYHGISSQ
jgi:hypothetical protein